MADSSFNRENSVCIAKLALEAGRYHDVMEEMAKVATSVDLLTPEERNLFARGFRSMIALKRNSYKRLSKIEQKDETRANEENVRLVGEYKTRVREEIMDIWHEVITILNHNLIPSIQTAEPDFVPSIQTAQAAVHFYTIKGDFWRYLAEFRTGTHWLEAQATQEVESAYEAALEAAKYLSRAHPLRLRLDLNRAVFYHTILEDTQRACLLVDRTFDEAMPVLSDLGPDDRKESNSLMHILDYNMNTWNDSSCRKLLHSSLKKWHQKLVFSFT